MPLGLVSRGISGRLAKEGEPMPRCSNCGATYKRLRSDQVTCSGRCNAALSNREAVRGRAVVRALIDWRGRRGTVAARDSLRWLAREVRDWIEEDAQHQRPMAPRHDHGRPKGHELKAGRGQVRLGSSVDAQSDRLDN